VPTHVQQVAFYLQGCGNTAHVLLVSARYACILHFVWHAPQVVWYSQWRRSDRLCTVQRLSFTCLRYTRCTGEAFLGKKFSGTSHNCGASQSHHRTCPFARDNGVDLLVAPSCTHASIFWLQNASKSVK
jgi:hypothetical protein